MTKWLFSWRLKNEFRTDWWKVSINTDGWLPWRQTNDTRTDVCVCGYDSCVCTSVICRRVPKWKKIAYGTKKDRTSIDKRVSTVVTLHCFSCLTTLKTKISPWLKKFLQKVWVSQILFVPVPCLVTIFACFLIAILR